jgi:hypothetical protein
MPFGTILFAHDFHGQGDQLKIALAALAERKDNAQELSDVLTAGV